MRAPSSTVELLPTSASSPMVARVHHAEVADGRARADLDAAHRRDVDHRAVLHVGAAAHHDRVEVGAEHGVVPDRRVLLHGDVADEARGGRDERGGMNARRLAFEREERHRVSDSRRSRRVPPSPGQGTDPGVGSATHEPAPDRRRRDRHPALALRAGARSSRMAGYDDAQRAGFFANSQIEGRAPLRRSRHVHARRERRPAPGAIRAAARVELAEAAVRRAVARAGWRPPTSTSSPPPRAPARLCPSLDAHLIARLGLPARRAARPRGRHRLRERDGRAPAGPQPSPRLPRASRGGGGGGDLLGRVLPRRSARERGGPRHLRRRGGRRSRSPPSGRGPEHRRARTLFRSEHLPAMGFEYPGGRPRVVLSKDVRRIGAGHDEGDGRRAHGDPRAQAGRRPPLRAPLGGPDA